MKTTIGTKIGKRKVSNAPVGEQTTGAPPILKGGQGRDLLDMESESRTALFLVVLATVLATAIFVCVIFGV
jgi:hypothetical protein